MADTSVWRSHRSGSAAVDELVAALAVHQESDGDRPEFSAISTRRPVGRIFGGQILAQATVAASATVIADDGAPAALPHSLHAHFLRAGRPDEPIRLLVDRIRDGRSYSTRRVDAAQGERVIATVTLSFQRPEPGPEHQDPMPDRVDPDELVGRVPAAAAVDGPTRAGALELRGCPSDPADRAASAVWMRVAGALPDDPALHRALLVYLSDLTVVHGAFRRHRLDRQQARTASLDHALWLHRRARMDDWVLYDSRSPSATGGRAAGQGRLFARSGELLAVSTQEMSVRPIG